MKLSQVNRVRLLYFLVFCCTAAWMPILIDYGTSRGFSKLQSSLIANIAPVMIFLVQPFYGAMADKMGYRKSLCWSSFMAACCFLLYLLNGGLFFVIAVTASMAIFYNSLQPILDSISLGIAKRDPKFSYGSLRIAGAAGYAFTGIVTGHLIDAIDINVIFIISAITMALTFLVAITIPEDKTKLQGPNSSFEHVGQVLKNPTLIFLLIGVFFISVGTSAIWNFYSTYMKENGASASLVGYGISFQGLCELPLFYFSARIIAKLGLKTTFLLTIFASAVRLLLYSLVKNPYAALPIELLHGFSWSLFWVVCVESVNKLVKEEWRVTGQSLLYASYFGAGYIIGNFWTGYLADSNMRVSEVYLLNAGIVSIVGLIIWRALRFKV